MSRRVKIKTGQSLVQLPNGFAYKAGDEVVLSDAEFALLSEDVLAAVLDDLGEVGASTAKNGKLILSAPSVPCASGAHVTHVWNTLVYQSGPEVEDWLEWELGRADGRVNVLEGGVFSGAVQVNAHHDTITDGERQMKFYLRHATLPDLSLVTRVPTAEAGRSGDTYLAVDIPAQYIPAGYYFYARSNWNYGTAGTPTAAAVLFLNRLV